MKQIRLFLASSLVEFKEERLELGNYIRSLNDIYVERGIYFKLDMCENVSSAVEDGGKQNAYNKLIRESDYFYVIFGKKAGEYTMEEFEVAMEQFRATGKPRVYTYFQQVSDGSVSQEVMAFMQRLDQELGHYYSLFTHIDSIKLNILLELSRSEEGIEIGIENGNVCVDGDRLLSLENIPVYAKNEDLNRLRKQMEELDGAFALAAAKYGKDPSNAALMQEMMELGHRRGKIADTVRRMEKDIFSLYTTLADIKKENRPLNWWEREAGRLLDLGNSEGALQILRDVQLHKELEYARDTADQAADRIRSVIHAKKMAIRVLRTKGLRENTVREILENYELIAENALKYHVEMDTLYDYADFAEELCDHPKVEELTEKLLAWLVFQGEKTPLYLNTLMLRSIAFAKEEKFGQAKKGFLEALELCKQGGVLESEKDFANVNNSLGMMLCSANLPEEAEEYGLASVVTLSKIVEQDPTSSNRCALANSYDTLSQIYDKLDRPEEAARISGTLYGILKDLVQENEKEYSPRYASACAHYALFLLSPDEFHTAVGLLEEALAIFSGLAKVDPVTYLPKVVWVMYLLGGKYFEKDNRKAYTYYNDAYGILASLPEDKQKNSVVNLTKLCSNLAVLCALQGEKERAEALMLSALEDCEKNYKALPAVHLIPLGNCYNNLMMFYKNEKKLDRALHYGEACRKLVEKAVTDQTDPPSKLLDLLAMTYYNLSSLKGLLQGAEAAEAYLAQSRYIWGKLRERDPDKYSFSYFRAAQNLAGLVGKKDPTEAEKMLREAFAYFSDLQEPCYEIAGVAAMLINFLLARGETDEAEEIQRQVLRLMEKGYQSDPAGYGISYAQSCNNLGAILSRRGDAARHVDELYKLYSLSTALFSQICLEGQDSAADFLYRSYRNCLNAVQNKRDTEGAKALFARVETCLEQCADRNAPLYRPLLATCLYDHANFAANTLGDPVTGKALLERSLSLAKEFPQLGHLAERIRQVLEKYFS